MASYEELAALVLEAIKEGGYLTRDSGSIPVGISNRHIHLSQGDLETLFGAGYQLTKTKDLSQPGQYACKETVIIAGPKGAIEKVRILGPVRSESQAEILQADCFKLGVTAPVKLSGDLAGTPGVTLIGPQGSVYLKRGLMIAQRHIHLTPEDAVNLGVRDGEKVTIQTEGLRGGTYTNVVIRATGTSSLEFHIDTEEANAMGLTAASKITIVK